MAKSETPNYDLIIIGSGPAGRAAAIQAGKLRRRVLVIDRRDRFGGVSVHTGTIPSKTLRETVMNLSGWRERSFYGRSYRAKDAIMADDLKARLHMTLDYEVDILEHQFNRNHVETLNGIAHFVGENEVSVATDDGKMQRDALLVRALLQVLSAGLDDRHGQTCMISASLWASVSSTALMCWSVNSCI